MYPIIHGCWRWSRVKSSQMLGKSFEGLVDSA
jgi:hypothetical protein